MAVGTALAYRLTGGLLTVPEAAAIAWATLVAGTLAGLLLGVFRDVRILWIGFVGLFFAVGYSLPPLKFSYRGLGELAVGVTFGPLMLAGSYLLQARALDWRAPLVGVPLGFLIANVLWINQFPDYEADRRGGKRTWVVRLGPRRAVAGHALLFGAAYASLAAVAPAFGSAVWLLPLAGAPLAVRAVRVAAHHYDDIPRLVPANADTVLVYQLTGFALLVATLLT